MYARAIQGDVICLVGVASNGWYVGMLHSTAATSITVSREGTVPPNYVRVIKPAHHHPHVMADGADAGADAGGGDVAGDCSDGGNSNDKE